jgi:hypothetical protein
MATHAAQETVAAATKLLGGQVEEVLFVRVMRFAPAEPPASRVTVCGDAGFSVTVCVDGLMSAQVPSTSAPMRCWPGAGSGV